MAGSSCCSIRAVFSISSAAVSMFSTARSTRRSSGRRKSTEVTKALARVEIVRQKTSATPSHDTPGAAGGAQLLAPLTTSARDNCAARGATSAVSTTDDLLARLQAFSRFGGGHGRCVSRSSGGHGPPLGLTLR